MSITYKDKKELQLVYELSSINKRLELLLVNEFIGSGGYATDPAGNPMGGGAYPGGYPGEGLINPKAAGKKILAAGKAAEQAPTIKAGAAAGTAIRDAAGSTKNYLFDSVKENLAKLGGYLKTLGLTAIGVSLISYVLSYFGKKLNSVSDDDISKMYKIAPPEIKQRIDELMTIKDKDPEKFQAGIRNLRDLALQDFKDKLKSKGVDVEGSTLGNILTKIGSFGQSFGGTIVITGLLFFILNALGLYTVPQFTDSVLPGPI